MAKFQIARLASFKNEKIDENLAQVAQLFCQVVRKSPSDLLPLGLRNISELPPMIALTTLTTTAGLLTGAGIAESAAHRKRLKKLLFNFTSTERVVNRVSLD